MCGTPMVAAGPPSGSRVPSNPTIHLFLPYARFSGDHEQGHIQVLGEGVEATVRRLSDSSAFEVRSVDVRTGSAKGFRIRVSGLSREDADVLELSYQVDPEWKAPCTPREVTLRDPVREKFFWTCSGKDVVAFHPSVDAPVYRVEWADTPEDYASGARQLAYFPHDPEALWSTSRHPDARIEIGYANCLGLNLPPRSNRPVRASDVRFLGVAAIFPDGSTVHAATIPLDVRSLPDVEAKEWTPWVENRRPSLFGPLEDWLSKPRATWRKALVVCAFLGGLLALRQAWIALSRFKRKQRLKANKGNVPR